MINLEKGIPESGDRDASGEHTPPQPPPKGTSSILDVDPHALYIPNHNHNGRGSQSFTNPIHATFNGTMRGLSNGFLKDDKVHHGFI